MIKYLEITKELKDMHYEELGELMDKCEDRIDELEDLLNQTGNLSDKQVEEYQDIESLQEEIIYEVVKRK